jgi:hypothetical protein
MREFVQGLTYQKGWSFATPDQFFLGGSLPGFACVVSWTVPSDYGHDIVALRGFVHVDSHEPDDLAWEKLLHGLWHTIERLEGHERMERLKVNGRRLWNPHPDGPDPLGRFVSVPEEWFPDRLRREVLV